MKNSFYLVIPAQRDIPERKRLFEEKALRHWIDELPIANPGLSTRLIFDLLKEFNTLAMSAQFRLDALEQLRASFLSTEDYLRFRLIKEGFPKSEDEQKIFHVLVEIEREFTLGYWIAVKELTRREIGWFQGKLVSLSIQRTISGLSHVIMTHYIMSVPVPDWVWIDIHSLYRLSGKIKKVSNKVVKSQEEPGKTLTIGECYQQILLLSLAQPEGLMQREILQVFNFAESLSSLLTLEASPIQSQAVQCVVLTDEDQEPRFVRKAKVNADSSALYVNFSKLYKALENRDKLTNKEVARFSSLAAVKNTKGALSSELLDYLALRWTGRGEAQGAQLFSDRLDRFICIGLEATHQLLLDGKGIEEGLELMVESTSGRSLSGQFNQNGLISIGSLISFRKKNVPVNVRSLGVVNKIITAKSYSKTTFEIQLLAGQVFPVSYQTSIPKALPQKALIYGVKTQEGEKSYIVMESFNLKEGDVIRMTMNQESFPIILRDRRNIGLGYWQFECRRIEEQVAPIERKKGFDFI